MKTQKKIWLAFVLNLAFAVFEFVGGIFTGSVAILSDALHDTGDAASICLSYALEKKSLRKPNAMYTYGYGGYSTLGSLITNTVLLIGSVLVAAGAVYRMIHPVAIHYDGMMVFAVVGVTVNLVATLVTHGGTSLNQRAVSLHMLEDVLGWVVVLIGAVIMRFTDLALIDPIMSLGVALFIGIVASKNMKETLEIFLDKTPHGIDADELKKHLLELDEVQDVHHLHVWSLDGQTHCATLHIVTGEDLSIVKKKVREELAEHSISHVTVETERPNEPCSARECHMESHVLSHIPRHHHHH